MLHSNGEIPLGKLALLQPLQMAPNSRYCFLDRFAEVAFRASKVLGYAYYDSQKLGL